MSSAHDKSFNWLFKTVISYKYWKEKIKETAQRKMKETKISEIESDENLARN